MENRETLPSLSSTYTSVIPVKCIYKQQDIDTFTQSLAFDRLLTFIMLLNQSVLGKKVSDIQSVSPQVQQILDLLDILDTWINDFPPLHNPQRFGNKAFRQWLQKVEQETSTLMTRSLPRSLHVALPELNVYWMGSFGNETRIDYGSGHELSFLAWLCGLAMMDYLTSDDYPAVVLSIFTRYLELVRKVQRTWSLEPAGSHGVWGLDDHQFLPYVWGSAQMIGHSKLKPSSITKPDIVEMMAKDYLYYRCIQYIGQVKRGPFHEHSPMLFDISAVASWNKVNTGMAKMYVAEVLKKVPVVQHFPFGHLFPFIKNTSSSEIE
ncbi:uncharacterized protein BX664DRAFT_280307 [Halteromyces radiatus]|uniref:uncharacterized protein n=1 Tax=Halteromyces radiatus TaxID=101107 RepID=UPI00221EE5C8|nr:uncharacterized protein BX664DRAFT_280307 [Halteromyces radiatus]KAI8089396.1 hypothetical protein BX664DRAFT_280307 [Halteromyces radiatus]